MRFISYFARKPFARRRSRRPREDAERVFCAFVRALEKLSRAAPGGAPAEIGALREKA